MSPPLKTVFKKEAEQKLGKLGTRKHPHPQMSPTKYEDTYPHRADRSLKQVIRHCMESLETVYEEEEENGNYHTMKHPNPAKAEETYDPLRANSIIRIQPSVMATQTQCRWMTPTLETIEEEDEIEIKEITVI